MKLIARFLRDLADRIDQESAPPGMWISRPRLGQRRQVDGRAYVLTSISLGDGLALHYASEGSWEASHLIDPHADCRRRRRRFPWPRRTIL